VIEPSFLSSLKITRLTANSDLSTFRSCNTDLYEFLLEDAIVYQNNRTASTHLVYGGLVIVGYFTLLNDCIEVRVLDPKDGQAGYKHAKYPAIKIARLATHQDYQKRGIGQFMLTWITAVALRLSEVSGCRIITVDSKPDAQTFYEQFGYKPTNRKHKSTISLYLDYVSLVESDKE